MIAFNNVDLLDVVTIFILLLVLIFTSVAEMALSRITRRRRVAATRFEVWQALKKCRSPGAGESAAADCQVCQTVQATLTGILSARCGARMASSSFALNVIVFSCWQRPCRRHTPSVSQKAALATARPVSALVAVPPLRLISRWLISLTNVIVRGKVCSRAVRY